MKRVNELAFSAWCKAQYAKQKVKDYFTSEEGGTESIIIAVVLVVLVLALAIAFRKQIWQWFNNLTDQANTDGFGGTGEAELRT